jgi:hypothetical protein
MSALKIPKIFEHLPTRFMYLPHVDNSSFHVERSKKEPRFPFPDQRGVLIGVSVLRGGVASGELEQTLNTPQYISPLVAPAL